MVKLNHLQRIVIDECDEFLKQNCQNEFVEFIKHIDMSKIQMILTSASMNDEIIRFSKEFQVKPVRLLMRDQSLSLELIQH